MESAMPTIRYEKPLKMNNESQQRLAKWSPVKVTLPRLLDVSQARYDYANGRKNFLSDGSRAWLRPTIS